MWTNCLVFHTNKHVNKCLETIVLYKLYQIFLCQFNLNTLFLCTIIKHSDLQLTYTTLEINMTLRYTHAKNNPVNERVLVFNVDACINFEANKL